MDDDLLAELHEVREELRDLRDELRHQRTPTGRQRLNRDLNKAIAKVAAKRKAADRTGVRPTRAEVEARIAERKALGQHTGYGPLAADFHVSVATIRRSLGRLA